MWSAIVTIWAFVKGIIPILISIFHKVVWLVGSFFSFPRWYMLAFWGVWFLVWTKPKTIDQLWGHVAKAGTYLKYVYKPKDIPHAGIVFKGAFAIPVLGWILWALYYLPFLPVHIVCWVLQYPKAIRFAVTLSLMNLLTSERVGKLVVEKLGLSGSGWQVTTAQWAVAASSVPIFLGWYFFLRGKAERDHSYDVLKRKGWFKGTLLLTFEDFVPKKWVASGSAQTPAQGNQPNQQPSQQGNTSAAQQAAAIVPSRRGNRMRRWAHRF